MKRLAGGQGMSLKQLLKSAGVSKTAYDSIAGKKTVVPRSVLAIARELGVPPSALMRDPEAEKQQFMKALEEQQRILQSHSGLDPDTVRHTLLLLNMEPEERLRRALLRGRTFTFH